MNNSSLKKIIKAGPIIFVLFPTFVLAASLKNPINTNSIQELLIAILNIVIAVLTPFVIVFLVLAGFKYVVGRGNPQTIAEANKALFYGLIGGVIILGAVAITSVITELVSNFK